MQFEGAPSPEVSLRVFDFQRFLSAFGAVILLTFLGDPCDVSIL